jgi:hypothetical protein
MSAQTLQPERHAEQQPVPIEVAEIETYAQAARRIVRDDKRARQDRLTALVRLVQKSRAEAALPDWCQRAIWAESADFIKGRNKPVPLATEPIERAVRALHAKGLIRCPTCRLLLPDEGTLDRWRRQRLAEALVPHLADNLARG